MVLAFRSVFMGLTIIANRRRWPVIGSFLTDRILFPICNLLTAGVLRMPASMLRPQLTGAPSAEKYVNPLIIPHKLAALSPVHPSTTMADAGNQSTALADELISRHRLFAIALVLSHFYYTPKARYLKRRGPPQHGLQRTRSGLTALLRVLDLFIWLGLSVVGSGRAES